MELEKPVLEDGFVAFVKQDCPTCTLIEPVLSQMVEIGILKTVFSQDNPEFPSLKVTEDDSDLELSFKYEIETVPTLLKERWNSFNFVFETQF